MKFIDNIYDLTGKTPVFSESFLGSGWINAIISPDCPYFCPIVDIFASFFGPHTGFSVKRAHLSPKRPQLLFQAVPYISDT